MKLYRCALTALAALALAFPAMAEVIENPQSVRDLLDRIGGKGTSDRITTIVDDSYGTADLERFQISALNGKPCIKGSTLSAVTTGIGWYLNHNAKVNLAWNRLTDDLSAVDFPVPTSTEEHSTTDKYRHYLNYCTFSYSMSTWTWERWQQEIDWMALHGINSPLHIIGLETVWRDLLVKDYGYSKEEANEFVAGPCFMAWFGMNNQQGWGGPNPDWWYTRQQELGSKMTARMHELGIEPVLPGFAGMVPSNFTSKTGIASNDQGGWCGFKRPNILTPASEGFNSVAANYYKRLDEVMGTSEYYSMDPFHEGGGSTGGVDAKLAYSSIYECLDKAHPGAKWFIQQWQWAGGQWQSVAQGVIPQGKLIVLDLYSDGKGGSQLNNYNGHETVYCMIPNFGARTGFFGRIATLINSYFDKGRPVASVKGVAAVPEGIEQVPVIYDLLYEMPWMDSKPDAAKWIEGYAERRYSADNAAAKEAWELLRTSALDCKTGLQGPHEAITCARPSLTANKVSTWGGSEIFYDTNSTAKAAYLLLGAGLSGENYSYDLVDICRQALTDYSKTLLAAVKDANDRGDAEAFALRRDAFLQLILDLDELLNTNKDFMVGHWTERARAMADEAAGTTAADREWLELSNARTLISTWGPQAAANGGGLHDYSYRQWGGIMKDYYYQRWKQWFDNGMKEVSGGWFNFEHNWAVDGSKRYPTTPVGSTAEVASRLLPRYISPLTSAIAGQETRYVQRVTSTDLKGKFFDSAKRGTDYQPDFNAAATTVKELAVDFNDNTLFEAGETSASGSIAIPADAPIGEHTVRITLADGTVVVYTLRIIEEITEPRTVSVATEDASKGTVSIDGTSALSVTGKEFYVVRANASSLYDFDHWEDANGNNLGNSNPMTYYGKEDIALKAFFADNRWGIPETSAADMNDIISYKQWVTSFSVGQNGETTEIYSATDKPEAQFVVVPTRIKAAPGGEFTINWQGNDGLKYTFLSAYADFDNDGTFETLLGTAGTKGSVNAAVVKGALKVLVPFNAVKGTTHVRLRFDGAWSPSFSSEGVVPPTALANRFVYDLLLDLGDSPAYPSTVTAGVNTTALGSYRTENMANVYVPGDEVIITAFPNPGSRVASFTDNHGRELPAEWISENSVRFIVYDNAHITINFEKEPINGWTFNWEYNSDGTAGIKSVVTPGEPVLDLSEANAGIKITGIDPAVFSGRDDLTEITLPESTLLGEGKAIHSAAHKGDGTRNKITDLAAPISGKTPWVMTIEGTIGSKNFNDFGSALYGNGTDALADNYSNGWSQYYLKANGMLNVKWDSGKEVAFGVDLRGDFKIVSEFDGDKTLVVTCTNAQGQSESHTIKNSSVMKDISRYATAIPSGMNYTLTFREPAAAAEPGKLFVGASNLLDIHVPATNTSCVEKNGVVYAKGGKNVIAYPEGRLHNRPFTVADAQSRFLHHDGAATEFVAEPANELHTLWKVAGNTLHHLNADAPAPATSAVNYALHYATGAPTISFVSGGKYLKPAADASAELSAGETKLAFSEPLTELTVAIPSGYSSHSFPVAVVVPSAVKCYYIDALNPVSGARMLLLEEGAVIPAYAGFLTQSEASVNASFPIASSVEADPRNLLCGTTLALEGDVYTLVSDRFVKSASAPANTAFFRAADVDHDTFGDSFPLDLNITGINGVESAADSELILFDLAGRRVNANPAAGIYITSKGNKIVIR